jgi:NADH:ubiquinone oxidoreductase subunit E
MVTVVICVGSSCYVRGCEKVAEIFERLIQTEDLAELVELRGAFCMEQCSMGVSVRVGDHVFRQLQPENADSFFYSEVVPLVRLTAPQSAP